MSDEPERKILPTLVAGGKPHAIVPQDFDSAFRIANAIVKANMAPRGLETPEKVTVAILHGLEIGLTPMAALQSIAVINGRPTVWGDGAMAIVQGSGLLENIKEHFEGEGDKRKAVCTTKRKSYPDPVTTEYSVADAKQAGLWNKAGPWTQYPDRMLKMRARGWNLRDNFADVLKGMGIAEEIQDTEMRDITPERKAPPPPPPKGGEPAKEPDKEQDKPAAKKPAPPKPKPKEAEVLVDKKPDIEPDKKEDIEDAIVEDVTNEPVIEEAPDDAQNSEIDATEFFESLEAEMKTAADEAEVEEIWTARDPLAVFDGDDTNIEIALAIKNLRLKELSHANR